MKKTGGVSTTLPVFFNPIFMKKRILITGGAGFIGSHLCKRLLDEGNEVLLTSSLRTPKFFVKEFSYFLMPCHQHGLRINLLVQR